MRTQWTAWTDAKTAAKARRVAGGVLDALAQLGRRASLAGVAPYAKTGGHVLSFDVEVDEGTWADVVVGVLATAQRLGSAWVVHGAVERELDASTNQVSLPGISLLTCSLRRSAPE